MMNSRDIKTTGFSHRVLGSPLANGKSLHLPLSILSTPQIRTSLTRTQSHHHEACANQ